MTRKKKLGVRLKIDGGKNKFHDGNPDWWGTIDIMKDKKVVGSAGFTITDLQIYVDSLNIDSEFQKLGYGSIVMDFLKGLSRFIKKPILLFSAGDSVGYYEKMEFRSCIDERYANKLQFEGEDPDPAERDLIWIPECLRRKRNLVVSV